MALKVHQVVCQNEESQPSGVSLLALQVVRAYSFRQCSYCECCVLPRVGDGPGNLMLSDSRIAVELTSAAHPPLVKSGVMTFE
mmetsp:Transcript_21869/g.49859  ORF Transcript_21869/g.49859 Transcript_21869/m.49859 type:complete len:83 (+) Transcript_21869:1098-1346(+)